MPQPDPTSASELRRRRRVRTKLLVQTEALRLFGAKGYQQTSVDEIANAAAISARTFFRYFPSKEDVVLWDEYDELTPQELWQVGPGEEPFTQLARRIRELTAQAYRDDPQRLLARTRLSLTVPEIRARFVERQLALLGPHVAPLGEALGLREDDLSLAMTVAAIYAAFLVAAHRWQRDDGRADLLALIDDALAALADSAAHLAAVGSRGRAPGTDGRA